jgi:tRNA threonylcarbamoyladenosine biosynthesis protein TsaE
VSLVLELAAPADTERLGRAVGERLHPGDVVVLSGPLGAGKTVLARGIGAGLGVRGPVTSPTFVIAREHPALPGGRGVPLVHVDAYRLGGIAELDDLDLDTDLLAAAVVVEWGEGMAERLSDEHLLIRLQRRADESRLAELRGPARLLPQGVMSLACPAVPETSDP